jgi:c-di-AMP phosphodiesterase-like protein
MPGKFVKVLKTIGRKWFIFLVVLILIVFLFNQIAAIIITIITIILFGLSYVPSILFSKKLSAFLSDISVIEDKSVARRLKRPLTQVQEKMYKLSKNQNKKDWLITYYNGHYCFYDEKIIKKFKSFYNKGLGEKEILEQLKNYEINTRAEIKAIEDTLVNNDRLEGREVSVKEYRDRKRYS